MLGDGRAPALRGVPPPRRRRAHLPRDRRTPRRVRGRVRVARGRRHPRRDRHPRPRGALRVRRRPRPADRAAQPPRLRDAPRRGARPLGSLRRHGRASSCSTSTASRRSTTRTATRPATRCCRRSPRCCASGSARTDLIARVGGDEFAVMINHVDGEARARHGRRAARADPRADRDDGTAPPRSVTVSAGIAAFDADHPTTVALIMEAADAALYDAKRAGRAQASLAPANSAATASASISGRSGRLPQQQCGPSCSTSRAFAGSGITPSARPAKRWPASSARASSTPPSWPAAPTRSSTPTTAPAPRTRRRAPCGTR